MKFSFAELLALWCVVMVLAAAIAFFGRLVWEIKTP